MNTLFPGSNRFSRPGFILPAVLICLTINIYSQEIRIDCLDEPLNQILISMRDDYGLMLSFDDRQLSAYKLTVNKVFASPDQAFGYLLRGLPIRYELSGGVYVFYKEEVKPKPVKFNLAGRILDKINHESLPFCGIMINDAGLISDASGRFSFTSTTDSIFNIKISYLGYYIKDTLLASGTNYSFLLTPSVIALQEIIITGSMVERSIQTGSSPGTSRLNHKVAYYLPGNGDNSIFNLLRLQPGILAAGEQSSDFIIWGSYEGQSQVIFDGFTLYGMKNFNDNISAINPYMAKDIKIMKGGFGAEYGERVGGIIDITGAEGSRLAPSAQFCINNMTLNGKFSIPFNNKSALVLAYRQTYYELYSPVKFSTSTFGGRGRQVPVADHYLIPDYSFRDMNLKYSGSSKRSDYIISLYGGKDIYSYTFDQEYQHRELSLDYSEGNIQLGGAASYGLSWNEKNTSRITLSFSHLQSERNQVEEIVQDSGNRFTSLTEEQNNADVNEVNGRLENRFTLTEHQTLDAGAGILYYMTNRLESMDRLTSLDQSTGLELPYLYLQDNITLFKKLTIKPGIRADYHALSGSVYLQPRLSAMYRINNYFKLNAAIGMYNQFVAKNMIMDTTGNYRFAWEVCDNAEIPVLNSESAVLGVTFNKNNFTISLEGYLKQTGGITRYIETENSISAYSGEGKTKGFDLFIKKEFRNQTLWLSYTLSKTEEQFPYFSTDEYLPAMHDQRHELKLAAMAKVKSFHFSANFVFGSGFPDPDQLPASVVYLPPYSRLDAAVLYKFSSRKVHLDLGFSVLNVLNTENIRYSNFTRIPTIDAGTVSLYADAVPFTPSLFLNFYY